MSFATFLERVFCFCKKSESSRRWIYEGKFLFYQFTYILTQIYKYNLKLQFFGEIKKLLSDENV